MQLQFRSRSSQPLPANTPRSCPLSDGFLLIGSTQGIPFSLSHFVFFFFFHHHSSPLSFFSCLVSSFLSSPPLTPFLSCFYLHLPFVFRAFALYFHLLLFSRFLICFSLVSPYLSISSFFSLCTLIYFVSSFPFFSFYIHLSLFPNLSSISFSLLFTSFSSPFLCSVHPTFFSLPFPCSSPPFISPF